MWNHQFGEPGLFPARNLTVSDHTLSCQHMHGQLSPRSLSLCISISLAPSFDLPRSATTPPHPFRLIQLAFRLHLSLPPTSLGNLQVMLVTGFQLTGQERVTLQQSTTGQTSKCKVDAHFTLEYIQMQILSSFYTGIHEHSKLMLL